MIKKYCEQIEVNYDEYKKLLNVTVATISELDKLFETELFKDYKADFEKSTKIINLKKSTQFIRLSAKEKQTELNKRLIEYLQAIEKDKLYYFILAYNNPCKVLIVKSPSDGKEQKQFLGYEWSGAKGQEGIKYNGGEIVNDIITPLFNPKNPTDTDKINYYIQQNFAGNEINTPNNYVSYANLIDLLDFSRKEFNKAISLTPKKNLVIETKWEIKKLSELIEIISGGTPDTNKPEYWNGDIPWLSVADFNNDARFVSQAEKKITELGLKNSSTKYLKEGDLIISARGTVGALAQLAVPMTFNQSCYGLRAKPDKIDSGYLYYILIREVRQFKDNASGITFGAITISSFDSVKIPLPPLPTQKQIVQECESIDAEVTKAHEIITQAKGEINAKVENQLTKGYVEKKLSEITIINPSKTEIRNVDENTIVSFVEMASVSNDGFIAHKEDRPLKDLKKGSFTYFRENDIIIAKITPCMENGKCALSTNLTNGLAMGSSEFHVFRAKAGISSNYVFYFLNREYIRKVAEKNMTGSSGHRRVPAYFYENLKIPVPSIAVQEQLVAEITELESKIASAQEIIKDAPNRKQAVMKKYL